MFGNVHVDIAQVVSARPSHTELAVIVQNRAKVFMQVVQGVGKIVHEKEFAI
jgi:hypothetical protein